MHCNLILDSSSALMLINENTIAIRIMAKFNPSLCDRGHLLNLIGNTFYLGQDKYEILMTEGVVGYPERMAKMATAVLIERD